MASQYTNILFRITSELRDILLMLDKLLCIMVSIYYTSLWVPSEVSTWNIQAILCLVFIQCLKFANVFCRVDIL